MQVAFSSQLKWSKATCPSLSSDGYKSNEVDNSLLESFAWYNEAKDLELFGAWAAQVAGY